ncbi:MAG: response regulator [bacterium]|nr:response regulator [Candidatus Kapabacteria bacterium]
MSEKPIRVLIVDDEPQIRRFLRQTLSSHGYTMIEAESGKQALQLISSERPDLVILDLGLPDIDGMDLLRRLREWASIPVIVLSVRANENEKIAALDLGADDYVTKPFASGELLARMRTAMRHQLQTQTDEPVFRTGTLLVDLARRMVSVNSIEVKLTPKEYDLLRLLVAHAGKVLTHQYLLREIWGPTYTRETHYLRVFIGTLRQKIEPEPARPHFILTEPGVGYRLAVN